MRDKSFRLECQRERETDEAIQVTDAATGEMIWFPLSTVLEMHFDRNEQGSIVVEEWIARKKGLT